VCFIKLAGIAECDKILVMKRLLLLIGLLILPVMASAHLDAGHDVVVDGHLIDFGYSPEFIEVGEPANFAFNLVDPDTEQPIEFESLWVRISSPERIVFVGSLFPELSGNVTFNYTFDEASVYVIDAVFRGVDGDIAEQNFAVRVFDNMKVEDLSVLILLALVLIVIVFSDDRLKSFLTSN